MIGVEAMTAMPLDQAKVLADQDPLVKSGFAEPAVFEWFVAGRRDSETESAVARAASVGGATASGRTGSAIRRHDAAMHPAPVTPNLPDGLASRRADPHLLVIFGCSHHSRHRAQYPRCPN